MMEPLPMAPATCSLDDSGLAGQLARYRTAGHGADVVEQSPRALVLRLSAAVPSQLVDDLIAVEQSCCPFFGLAWEPDDRRLSISVLRPEHERALEAIAYALGLS